MGVLRTSVNSRHGAVMSVTERSPVDPLVRNAESSIDLLLRRNESFSPYGSRLDIGQLSHWVHDNIYFK